jgi:hypothetical protein
MQKKLFNYDHTKIKFQTIKQYCQKSFIFSSQLKNFEIKEKHNLLYLETSIPITSTNWNLHLIHILFYYDWFPHIGYFIINPIRYNYNKLIYYLLVESQKPNALPWMIFHNEKKLNLNLENFLEMLIDNCPDINWTPPFLTLEKRKLFRCVDCLHNKFLLKIANKYLICIQCYHSNPNFYACGNWSNKYYFF